MKGFLKPTEATFVALGLFLFIAVVSAAISFIISEEYELAGQLILIPATFLTLPSIVIDLLFPEGHLYGMDAVGIILIPVYWYLLASYLSWRNKPKDTIS